MSSQQTGFGGSSSNPFSVNTQTTTEDNSKPVQYACGDCDAKVVIGRGNPIRCKECGHRVLYKERTNRMVQFEAR